MLQNLHDNLKGVTAWILVGIITIPFVFFGVDSLFLSGSSVEKTAEVNGEKITRLQFDRALQIRRQQLLNRFGDLDPGLLNDELLREPVLQGLISEKVIEQSARKNGMDVPAVTAYGLLQEVPDYQVDGKFDPERYEFAIRRMGFTPTSHIDEVRAELLRNQFVQGIALTGVVTTKEIEQLASITNETRDYYYLTVAGAPLLETINPSEDDILAYYSDNSANYMSEETVVVEYVDLRLEDFFDDAVIEESTLENAYQTRIASLEASNTKQVAHILLDAEQADVAADIQGQLAAGADFAELAKTYSQDPGSANQGGDLGYVQQGDLPEAMERAIDALAVGDVSGPIETESGVHLIKLLAAGKGDIPSLESLRPELEETLKRDSARNLLAEAAEEMAESAYNAASLKETADLMGRELMVSDAFSRAGGPGIAGIPGVVNAAFSDDVLLDGYPSDILEIGNGRALVLRVTEHRERAARPLEEVREEVQLALTTERKNQLLGERGAELIEQVAAGASVEDIAKASDYPWQVSLDTKRIGGNVNGEIRDYAFTLDAPRGAPTVDGFVNSEGDFVVVSLTAVEAGKYSELDAQQSKGIARSSRLAGAERELSALRQMLVDAADIEVN